MSWKCDKCKNTYEDDVKAVETDGFKFCPNCVGNGEEEVAPIKEKTNSSKIVAALLIAAALVIVGAIVSAVVLFICAKYSAAIITIVCAFIAVIILSSVADTIKKNSKNKS